MKTIKITYKGQSFNISPEEYKNKYRSALEGKTYEYEIIDVPSPAQAKAQADSLRKSANEEMMNEIEDIHRPTSIEAGLRNAFPRTLAGDENIFEEGDLGGVERTRRGLKALVNVPLDILSNTGRLLASVPSLADGEVTDFNTAMRMTTPKERGDDVLSNLQEMGAGVLRDPLTPISFTPTGSFIGELGRTGALPSLAKLIGKTPQAIRGAVGLGAGEAGIQNAVTYLDQGLPEDASVASVNAIVPTVANAIGFKMGVTPDAIKQRAVADFENAIAPNKSITRRFGDKEKVTSAKQLEKMILEPNLADVEGQNQATQVLNNVRKAREELFERQREITQSPIFNDPNVSELSLNSYIDDDGITPNALETAIYDWINSPNEKSLTGKQHLPSQISEYIKLFEGTETAPKLKSDLRALFDMPEKVSLGQLLEARKQIDNVAEKKGMFKQNSEELSNEAELYRVARNEINNQILQGIENIQDRKARPMTDEAKEAIAGLFGQKPSDMQDPVQRYESSRLSELANLGKSEKDILTDIDNEIAKTREFPVNQRKLYENYVIDDILSDRQQVIDKNSKSTPVMTSILDNKLSTLLALAKGVPVEMAEGIRSGRGDLGAKQSLYNKGRYLQGKSSGNTPTLGMLARTGGQATMSYQDDKRPTYTARNLDELKPTEASEKRRLAELIKKQ